MLGNPDVLLVEDSNFMSMRVVETLESVHEMNVTAVETADEARNELDKNNFECVIVNYELPDETGIELASSINSFGAEPEVPIILLTGRKLEPLAKDAIKKGVTEFVYKGEHAANDMDVLAHRIRVMLRAYGSNK